METLTADGSARREVACGGERIGNRGYFFAPTVLTDVPLGARVVNEEGAVQGARSTVIGQRYGGYDSRSAKYSTRWRMGSPPTLTRSAKTMADVGRDVESGMVSISHHGLAPLPELPFGGVKIVPVAARRGLEPLGLSQPKLVAMA